MSEPLRAATPAPGTAPAASGGPAWLRRLRGVLSLDNTRRRSRAGLLLAAVIFVGIGAGVVGGAQQLVTDAAWVSHSTAVIGRVDEVVARLRDTEAAARGYLLTGNPVYLADYRSQRDGLPQLNEDLERLVSDTPAQKARAHAFEMSVRQRLAQIAYTLASYEEGGLPAAQASMGPEIIAVSTAIRRQADAMRDAERALLAERAASTRMSGSVLRALALLGIPLGLAVIAAVYWLLVREVRRRARAEDETAAANEQLRISVGQLEQGSADLRALSRYGNMLQSCADADDALELTRQMLSTLLPGTGGALYRMRDSKDHAEAALHWGVRGPESATTLPPDACWALRRGQMHVVGEGIGLRCPHVPAATGAGPTTACMPLVAQGAQLGLLYLADDDAGFMSRGGIIEAVADQLSMALSNLALQERLRLQSIREPLTGLFNRRYLEESATRELARCHRRGVSLALMMLDLDHFKAFNDLHGHPGGDALLAAFGRLMQTLSRPEDIACRYGGEEFTLILPEVGRTLAMQRAEAIRAAVEAMRVEYLGRELPTVTVSIGVAVFPVDGATQEALLRAADAALYRAKRGGRNRVETAPAQA